MFFLIIAASNLIVPNGQKFSCTPTHVWDGDGPIWCAEGPRVRLAGIAAREMDDSCRINQPCPDVPALVSRDALAGLVGEPYSFGPHGHVLVTGPAMSCISTGSAGGNRTGAWCTSPANGDISCAMVNNGYALRWDRYWGQHSCDQ